MYHRAFAIGASYTAV